MTIVTCAFIYVAVVAMILSFFRHLRSCDDHMSAAFQEAFAVKCGVPNRATLVHHAH